MTYKYSFQRADFKKREGHHKVEKDSLVGLEDQALEGLHL